MFSADVFQNLYSSFQICTSNLELRADAPRLSPALSTQRDTLRSETSPPLFVYILTLRVQHVICPRCSTLVSQLPSPEAGTPVFSL